MYKEKIAALVFWKNGNSKRLKISSRCHEVSSFTIKTSHFYHIKIESYNPFNNVHHDTQLCIEHFLNKCLQTVVNF